MQVQHDKKYSLPNYYFIEENDYSAEKSNNNSQSPPPTTNQQYFQGSASQGSYVESMTPQRMNRIVDWTRNHVTPGDSKNIFPQVIAPSIEFSNDNSVSLNLNSMQSSHNPPLRQQIFKKQNHESPQFSGAKKQNSQISVQKKQVSQAQERVVKYAWDHQKRHMEQELITIRKTVIRHEQEYLQISEQMQEHDDHMQLLQQKHKDYSNLETLRGKMLENSRHQLQQLKQQSNEKDMRINLLENEIHRLQINESHIQEAIEQELKELYNKMNQDQTMVKAIKSQYQDEQVKIQGIKYNHESDLTGAAEQLINVKHYADEMYKKVKERENYIQNQEEQIIRMREEFQDLQVRLEDQQQTHQAEQKIIKDLKFKEEMFLLQNQPGYRLVNNQVDNNAYEELQRECLNYKRQVANLKEQLGENQTFQQIRVSQKPSPTQSFRIGSPQQQDCQQCNQCKEELASMIQECSLEQEASNLFNQGAPLENLIREVTTLLLTKQREQIDQAIEQYDIQQQEMNNQIIYFKEQNDEVMAENNRIQDQIQNILKAKEQQVVDQIQMQEIEIFEQYDHLKQQNDSLASQLRTEREKCNMYHSYNHKSLDLKLFEQNKHFTQDINHLQQEKQVSTTNNYLEDKKIFIEKENSLKTQIKGIKDELMVMIGKYDRVKKDLEKSEEQLDQYREAQKSKDSSQKKKQHYKEKQEKAVQQLIDDKQRLQSKLQDVQQAQSKIINYGANLKSLEEKYDQSEKSNKQKDKKNIELYSQIKNLQLSLKQTDEQIKFYKEDSDKHQKTITFKNQQIKNLMDQVKGLQDKNSELSSRLVNLSQQVNQFEEDMNSRHTGHSKLDVSPSQEKPQRFPSNDNSPSNMLNYLKNQSNKEHSDQQVSIQNPVQNTKVIEMYEQINNYQLRGVEIQNERRNNVGSTTLDEMHGRTTQDSINLRSFLNGHERKNLNDYDYSLEHGSSQKKVATNVFQHHMQIVTTPTITELVQPEMLSVEDTIALLREVLRRAVRSVEVVRAVMEVSEIKELLGVIVLIEQKMKEAEKSDPHFHNKKNRLLNSIILNSNVKSILGSELGRKKNQSNDKLNQKISQRSDDGPRGLIDFIDS